MNGVGLGLTCGIEHRGSVQIRLRRRRSPNLDRLIREVYGKRFPVCLAVDLHGADAEFARRTNDAHGNFAPVCDKEFTDGHRLAA